MRIHRSIPALFGLAMLVAACSPNALNMAPPSAETPWVPNGKEDGLWSTRTKPSPRGDNFGVPANPALAVMPQTPDIDGNRVYKLPELIDLAERNNPATRVAWERARQAALAVGMAEATYLPVITANVIGGQQTAEAPLPAPIGTQRYFETTASGVTSTVALQWLVFDFGQRAAVVDAAKQAAIAANVLFNGEHQKLIFDVTNAYYVYGASVTRAKIAQQTLKNSKAIQSATEDRLSRGLATSVETAQARQQVAQSQLRLVQAQGQQRDTYQALIAAMGINAMTRIQVADAGQRRLPDLPAVPLDSMIKLALSQRPDVIASYSAVQASKSGIKAAEAEFMPKVFVAGAVASGQGGFNVNGLSNIGQQSTGSGVLVGATVPLYDGGLRDAQLKQAQSVAAAAESTFRRTQTAAVTEIVAASNALRTALESYKAASALAAAAYTTYDAALEAYKHGVGTVTAATAADTGLLDARQAQADSHAAALVSAANLAFVVGAMTSEQAAAGIPQR
ncbi:TolC family protein [Kaistia dalseonensis]|uniref:Protein CyaE n=1 Tax=Kaistia dalseonensis TaxID=410840 RepID=A0ABU0H7N1_9HYPH|nr:TolC family protein [Kaistia dalseonensis]MCX5495722.1 TolC family protein [Kaistia dalseonensis]MDQ0438319.1 outer membrane protein TolC [Kaistia dalseonensis]